MTAHCDDNDGNGDDGSALLERDHVLLIQDQSTASRSSSISSSDLTTHLLQTKNSSSLVTNVIVADDFDGILQPQRHDAQPRFNYKTAFAAMAERRVQRKYRGVYKKYSASTQIMTWLIVLYVIAVFVVNSARSTTETQTFGIAANVFTLILNLLIIYLVVEIVLVVRWLVYWVIVAELATFTITGRLDAVVWVDTDISDDDKAMRRVILVLLVVAEAVTIVCHVVTHYVYPWIVRRRLLNADRWWNIVVHPSRYALTYRSLARFYKRKRVAVTYCGGLDALGQPHGFGIWSDTSFHGEQLRGQWDHGVPIGPFQSQESGSGYCFVNLRIAYCHNRAEAAHDQVLYIPKHAASGLHWGVASVECSVSGGFFSFLPQVQHLTDSSNGAEQPPPTSALECLPYLRTPLDAIHALDETSATRSFSFRTTERLASAPRIGQAAKEALVFLHGYNCALDYGLTRLAQLLALGNFPSHIHPFVFSWPTGGTLAYFPAKSLGSESERTATDFRDFLASLVAAGYASINIVAHSMGARIFFNALSRGLLDSVFCEHTSRLDAAALQHAQKARLASLILANPDYPRDDFVCDNGGYDRTRRFCHQITVYADERDGALIWSELLVRKRLFDPLAYSMGKRVHTLHRDRDADQNRHSSRWSAVPHHIDGLALDMSQEAVEKNQRAGFPDVAAYAFSYHCDGARDTVDADDEQREFLDIDVIDTTWMDNNVHNIRHNYFNLNPTLIEDIRQTVVFKRRARARPGVMRTTGNVYIFLVAPSHVKNE